MSASGEPRIVLALPNEGPFLGKPDIRADGGEGQILTLFGHTYGIGILY
jgi:hypothetical protein